MNTAIKTVEPKLDAPGAGLPAMELFVARTMFRIQRWLKPRAFWDELFETERSNILALVSDLGDATSRQQVLVRRIRGLEDSSRFWSVCMVLDHLNIVNKTMLGAIVSLLPQKNFSGDVVERSFHSALTVTVSWSIVREVMPGYRFEGKLLRAAMVVVAKAPTESTTEEPASE